MIPRYQVCIDAGVIPVTWSSLEPIALSKEAWPLQHGCANELVGRFELSEPPAAFTSLHLTGMELKSPFIA